MSFLITQSLLSAWQYLFSAREGGEEAAKEDFLRVLRREPGEQTEAMREGAAFESLCYRIADGQDVMQPAAIVYDSDDLPDNAPPAPHIPYGYDGACKIAEIIKDGQYQVKLSRHIRVGEVDFLLYGILDCLKAGVIYDIKYKTKSFGSVYLPGTYLDSPQHPVYLCLVPEASRFEYLVSDGRDLYREVYTRADSRSIGDIISEFTASLFDMGLWNLYTEKWMAKS